MYTMVVAATNVTVATHRMIGPSTTGKTMILVRFASKVHMIDCHVRVATGLTATRNSRAEAPSASIVTEILTLVALGPSVLNVTLKIIFCRVPFCTCRRDLDSRGRIDLLPAETVIQVVFTVAYQMIAVFVIVIRLQQRLDPIVVTILGASRAA